jgi:DNA-binding CsgD family transcriptional regulator
MTSIKNLWYRRDRAPNRELSNFALGYGLFLGDYGRDSNGWKHGKADTAQSGATTRGPYGAVSGDCNLIRSVDQPDGGPLRGLTTKQCEVLDLLIQHKTSKEISRHLGISPHTVDQRIMLARAKLQVASRSEVAQAYRRLLDERPADGVTQSAPFPVPTSDPDIYGQSIYGSSDVAYPSEIGHNGQREEAVAAPAAVRETGPDQPVYRDLIPRQMVEPASGEADRGYYHVLPEAFDGRGGTLLRLGAILMIAVFVTLVILGGLAMYSELSHMLDG